MKKILLVCGGGMSTSLLVKKMEAADIYNEYQIKCSDVVSGQVLLVDYDIILLAPHIAYLQNEFVPLCQKVNIPLMLIDSYDYTKMAGKIVLDKAIMLLNEFTKKHPFKVLLLHSVAGAMSDLIVLDMKKKVIGDEKDWQIESLTTEQFEDKNYDIILLEPQIRYEEVNLERRLKENLTIITVPPISLYASFDGRKVLDYIKRVYNQEIDKKRKKVERRVLRNMKLIMRADDLGFSEGVNYGIYKSVVDGVITSVGMMPNMASAKHGYELVKDLDIALGQHSNICVGKPLSAPKLIPSLV